MGSKSALVASKPAPDHPLEKLSRRKRNRIRVCWPETTRSSNFFSVSSKYISLAAQSAIDSSGTVKAEVGDEPDDRGRLQFIRFVED